MIFEVTADHVGKLDDAELRDLVGRLCVQDIRRQNHSPSAVTFSGHQDAADGGIDVRVDLPADAVVSGYIPKAATGFQVKAEDMPPAVITKEMRPRGALRRSIAGLAAKGGAYIIVSSKGSVADGPLQKRKPAMRVALGKVRHAKRLTVDFYDRQRIASWVNEHPGLIPWVRLKVGYPLSGWHPFSDWSSSPASLDSEFLLDEGIRLSGPTIADTNGLNATDGVNRLRELLRKPGGIVRLVGLSGVGKTRLVQALFDHRVGKGALSPHSAVYTDNSQGPDPVPVELTSHLLHLRQPAVLIIDNCGAALHRTLVGRMAAATNCQISLITIEYDITDDEPGGTDIFRLDVASVFLIDKILAFRFPALIPPTRQVIAEFSGGNSRIAFAIAATIASGESLADFKDSELFERLFQQSKAPNHELLNAARACALLYSFDGETLDGDASELVPLATLAGQSVDHLHRHVAELTRRQLVQKRSKWRAILPHALAHRLAKLALQDIPFRRIEDLIVAGKSERLIHSFSRRIGCLHDDEQVVALVKKWLDAGGLLEGIGKLKEREEEIFQNIAPVDPAATLAAIENAARQAWFFSAENKNTSQLVRILRSIAYDAALFNRAVPILIRFSVGDQDDILKKIVPGLRVKTDSTPLESLKSLFHLYLSGTHAPSAQRAEVVEGLLGSRLDSEKFLGLELLSAMLTTSDMTSHYSFEFGARRRDYGLHPKTWDDMRAWYRAPVSVALATGVSGSIAADVRRCVATHFSGLLRRSGLTDELTDLADTFARNGGWPEGWVSVRSAMKRCHDKTPEAHRRKLEELEQRLRPADLESTVRAYALPPEWGSLDIADVEQEADDKPLQASTRISGMCIGLGEDLARNPDKLESLLPEIVASDSNRADALGRGIASGCASLTACWSLLKAGFLAASEHQRKLNALCGFLEAARRRSPEETDAILDAVKDDEAMHPHLLRLEAFAGLSHRSYGRLLGALEWPPFRYHPTNTFLAGARMRL